MNATDESGHLTLIPDCYLQIGSFTYNFNNLPEIGESKSASYNDESVIGRSTPIKTYANSDNRSFSLSFSLVVQDKSDFKRNLRVVRYVQGAVYPRLGAGAPYFPPIVCKLKCGKLLSNEPICCVMKDYNIKYPTDVPWDRETLCPYKMEISINFDQVFASNRLPNYDTILRDAPL